MTQEALKLALEALEENHHLIEEYERPEYCAMYDRAISAVRKALAQPEQLHASEDVSIGVDVTEDGAHVTALRSYRNGAKVVFYSQFHSAPQRTEQEPDVQETLHWHAFNYRQAHTAQAHEMWEKLEQFVDSKIKAPQRTEQDGKCKRCTDGCPACDATKLQKESHDLL